MEEADRGKANVHMPSNRLERSREKPYRKLKENDWVPALNQQSKNQRLNWPRAETETIWKKKKIRFAAIDKTEGNTLHSERQEKQNGALHPAIKFKSTNKATKGCYGVQRGIHQVNENSLYVE